MKRKTRILHNRIRCRGCGDVIESKSVHDWVCCSCYSASQGSTGVFCDGGDAYLRRGGQLELIEELSESRPYTDEERDEWNRQEELKAEQFGGWYKPQYME